MPSIDPGEDRAKPAWTLSQPTSPNAFLSALPRANQPQLFKWRKIVRASVPLWVYLPQRAVHISILGTTPLGSTATDSYYTEGKSHACGIEKQYLLIYSY